MANINFYKANMLVQSGVALLNGNPGAPARSEDPDWPMTNLLIPDRYSYWKSAGDGASPVSVDFDLGASQAIVSFAITNFRYYGTTALTNVSVDVYADSTYPPSTYIDTLTSDINDILVTLSATTRYWRFDVATPGAGQAVSMKLWLVRAADKVTFTHDWSLETRNGNRRLREEKRSPAGLLYAYEPAIDLASNVREAELVLENATQAEWDSLRSLADVQSRFLFADPNGVIWESVLPEGKVEATRKFANNYEIRLLLEQHP